jgi:hypothetical protein
MDDNKDIVPIYKPIPDGVKISRDPLDDVKIGDFYWVKFDGDDGKNHRKENTGLVRFYEGGHEHLMCVAKIGSNYVGFKIGADDRCSINCRVHFNTFFKDCTPEPNWRAFLVKQMDRVQKQIQEKTRKLIEKGQEMCLIPKDTLSDGKAEQPQSLLPAVVSGDPKKHKAELIKLQKSLPEIEKEIGELGKDYGVLAVNQALPDLVKLEAIKDALGVVEDRIFTIELYCGILEEAKQIATGEPATIDTPVTIRQQMLFMDEETLFDYDDGGMDFNKVELFDEWVVKPANISRILPEPRGIVAFRVRRENKDYGRPASIADAFRHADWATKNMQTYLLIRNGENVFRIMSDVNFTPRLIPKVGEIGRDQFLKIDPQYVWRESKTHDELNEIVTPEDVEYDDHVDKVDSLLKHYNRIVILIQGMLDRSTIFHPHLPINLCRKTDMEKWIVLLRDEEKGLPSNRVTWEGYHKQINSTLERGKWIVVDPKYDERWEGGENPNYDRRGYQEPPKRGWQTARMPDLIKVQSIKKDGSAVRVSWPKGERSKAKKVWVESKDRPGWGHYDYDYSSDAMCHEWIPMGRVFNLSDYNPGDYKMFLCDRSLQGDYLKWAIYLLPAENWARNRAKGLKPEDDPDAQCKKNRY